MQRFFTATCKNKIYISWFDLKRIWIWKASWTFIILLKKFKYVCLNRTIFILIWFKYLLSLIFIIKQKKYFSTPINNITKLFEKTKQPSPYHNTRSISGFGTKDRAIRRSERAHIIHLYVTRGLFSYIFTGENSGIPLMHIKLGFGVICNEVSGYLLKWNFPQRGF